MANPENRINNITACTCSMVNQITSNSESICLNEIPIETIEIIAKIKELKETALRYEVTLTDPTGVISAFCYKNVNKAKACPLAQFELTDNGYVLAYGTMRRVQESFSFILTFIENVKERIKVDEFLTRTLLGAAKGINFKGKFKKFEEIVEESMRNAGFSRNGFTSKEISNFLKNGDFDKIEETLNEMLMKGKVKNGIDWNHYVLV